MSTVKITKSFSDFAAEGASVSIDSGYSLPANSAITGVVVTKSGFSLVGATFMQLLVGTAENNSEIAQLDVTTSDPATQDELIMESRDADTSIKLMLIVDSTLSLNDLSGGDVTMDFIVEALPA